MQHVRISNHASHCARLTVGEPIIKIVLGLPASSEVDVECDFVGVPFPSHTTSAFGKEFVSISRFECFSHQRTANFRGPVHSGKRACNPFMAPLTFRQLVEVSTALSTLVPIAVADVQTACNPSRLDLIR